MQSNRKLLKRLYEAKDIRLAGIRDSTIRSHLGLISENRPPSTPSLMLALRYQRAVGLPLEGWLTAEERKWVAS